MATFETGKSYSLAKLFSQNNKIIIPDLQRDYCWADKGLVEGFVFELRKHIGEKTWPLGLIYAYEPVDRHINICDGQQRLTTLFLLLGVLNRKCGNEYKDYIISEEEQKDDYEPYLLYSIRESTLYFLSDLSRYYFIGETDFKLEELRHQPWYFSDYDEDPSIVNILSALEVIEGATSNLSPEESRNFAEFILKNLELTYYDVGSRSNGEETYVIINTTGEPLSPTENLKPRIVQENSSTKEEMKKVAEKWEEIEGWFWKNRGENETADLGFNEFLHWVCIMHDKKYLSKKYNREDEKFPLDDIDFNLIYDNYKATKRIFEDWELGRDYLEKSLLAPKSGSEFQPATYFRLLPLIEYVRNHNDALDKKEGSGICIIDSLYMILRNMSHLANVSYRIGELIENAFKIIDYIKDDITDLLNASDNALLTDCEIKKLGILKATESKELREKIEKEFWAVQDANDYINSRQRLWLGDILPLIDWSYEDGKFSLPKMMEYDRILSELFANKREEVDDNLRRALISYNFPDYPVKGNFYSFCYEWEDWNSLIKEHNDDFKKFLDEFAGKECGEVLKNIIDGCGEQDFSEFVKYDYLLEYMNTKRAYFSSNNEGWVLVQRQWAQPRPVNILHIYHFLQRGLPKDGWWLWINDKRAYLTEVNMKFTLEMVMKNGGKTIGLSIYPNYDDAANIKIQKMDLLRRSLDANEWEEEKNGFIRDIEYDLDGLLQTINSTISKIKAAMNE